MDRRTSKKVKMVKDFPDHDVIVRMNASLFEWVIENLSKNAVDAMGGEGGRITLRVDGSFTIVPVIEVDDTGKGIRKKDLKQCVPTWFYHEEAWLGTWDCLWQSVS